MPICPLCNAIVPVPRNQSPDLVISSHIDNECKWDSNCQKIYINRCTQPGCKKKEVF